MPLNDSSCWLANDELHSRRCARNRRTGLQEPVECVSRHKAFSRRNMQASIPCRLRARAGVSVSRRSSEKTWASCLQKSTATPWHVVSPYVVWIGRKTFWRLATARDRLTHRDVGSSSEDDKSHVANRWRGDGVRIYAFEGTLHGLARVIISLLPTRALKQIGFCKNQCCVVRVDNLKQIDHCQTFKR